MSAAKGVMFVGPDMAFKGSIRNCQVLEVAGYVEGEIAAQSLVIYEGGQIFGKLRAEEVQVFGIFNGKAFVKNLLRIGSGGSVSGNVQYGQLAMDIGADLEADVRNVPPTVFGDLDLSVTRGQAVQITLADLTAVDPDDAASALTYAVSHPANGYVELSEAPGTPVIAFTQADLDAGRVAFRHDGNGSGQASFEVVVSDAAGSSSGAPAKVHVTVR